MKTILIAIVAALLISGCGCPAGERPQIKKSKDSPSGSQAATDTPAGSEARPANGATSPADGAATPADGTATAANSSAAGASVDPVTTAGDEDVPLGEPDEGQPVVVAASIFPSRAKPGEVVTMVVRFRTALGWHFFAMDDRNPQGPVTPTSLELDLPQGLAAEEDWVLPPAEDYLGPAGPGKVYGDDVTFRRRIKIAAGHASGSVTIPCRVNYQTCSDRVCLRPKPETLEPKLEVVNR